MQTHYTEAAIRADSKVRTKEQRAELLIKANILDSNGDYVKNFFSSETIRKDKARREAK